jgi:hypothetical protein
MQGYAGMEWDPHLRCPVPKHHQTHNAAEDKVMWDLGSSCSDMEGKPRTAEVTEAGKPSGLFMLVVESAVLGWDMSTLQLLDKMEFSPVMYVLQTSSPVCITSMRSCPQSQLAVFLGRL